MTLPTGAAAPADRPFSPCIAGAIVPRKGLRSRDSAPCSAAGRLIEPCFAGRADYIQAGAKEAKETEKGQ